MDDKPVKRSGGGAATVAVIVAVFLILPMVYLLAIGPIVWLHRRGYVDVDQGSIIARAYSPAEWAASACPPFAQAIEAYVSLWVTVVPPTRVAPMPMPAPANLATPATSPTPTAPASPPEES